MGASPFSKLDLDGAISMPLYIPKEKKRKREHKQVNTGYASDTYQDRYLASRFPGWKRCNNIKHLMAPRSRYEVCIKECKS